MLLATFFAPIWTLSRYDENTAALFVLGRGSTDRERDNSFDGQPWLESTVRWKTLNRKGFHPMRPPPPPPSPPVSLSSLYLFLRLSLRDITQITRIIPTLRCMKTEAGQWKLTDTVQPSSDLAKYGLLHSPSAPAQLLYERLASLQ